MATTLCDSSWKSTEPKKSALVSSPSAQPSARVPIRVDRAELGAELIGEQGENQEPAGMKVDRDT